MVRAQHGSAALQSVLAQGPGRLGLALFDKGEREGGRSPQRGVAAPREVK
jgi:hypothetical protein